MQSAIKKKTIQGEARKSRKLIYWDGKWAKGNEQQNE